jgi:hypothetical protein
VSVPVEEARLDDQRRLGHVAVDELLHEGHGAFTLASSATAPCSAIAPLDQVRGAPILLDTRIPTAYARGHHGRAERRDGR